MTSPNSKSSPSARSSQASSPAGSGLGSSHGALPPTPVSPFFGNYPNAPHLRPIALPEMTPAMAAQMSLAPTPSPGYARTATPGPAPTPGSHSRGMSLPSPFSGPGSMLFGMPSPASPTYQHQLAVHPLLRSDNGASPLYYNALFQPNLRNPLALHHSTVQLHDRDLHQTAINPPCNSLSVTVTTYPGSGDVPTVFPWKVTLTSPRRSSVPNPGQTSVVTVYDVLASLWASLNRPVIEELSRFRPDQIAAARVQRTYRLSTGAVPNADPSIFVRADFLYGCVVFAGITRNPSDSSLSIMLIPQTN